jgi:hypothetical protein
MTSASRLADGRHAAGQVRPRGRRRSAARGAHPLPRHADWRQSCDAAAASALFTTDATFEDLTLHTTMVGQQAIGGVLDRAAALLPYGPGTSVRHVVGTA